MIRMICTDLDGTLLLSDKTISRYSLSVLREAAAGGTEIVPVTGRHLGGIPKEIAELDINYAVVSNGAGLYDMKNKKWLKEEFIPDHTMDELLEISEELDIMADIFTEKDAYTDSRNLEILKEIDASDAVKNYIRNSRVIVGSIKDFYRDKRPHVQKITMNFRKKGHIYHGKEEIKSILKKHSSLSFVTGGANNIEVTSSSATKGDCIKYLSGVCGISLEEIAGIGDTENDISMLETVGVPAAVENADDAVKKLCRYHMPSNDENGAAFFIDNILKGRIIC